MDKKAILEYVSQLKTGPFKATAIKLELEADIYDRQDEASCLSGIMKNLAYSLGEELTNIDDPDYDETYDDPLPQIRYAHFYDDGSVNSELTITIRLNKAENIFILPKIIDAWNEYFEGQEVDVRGAGMHMALLNSKDCSYPVERLSSAQLRRFDNFKRSMTPLLPALFFLGAHSSTTRGLGFRVPQVSATDAAHGQSKFSAISYSRGALEFRVFDTTYDNPDAVLDNFAVMAKAMQYWRLGYKSSGIQKIARRFQFGSDDNDELQRLYTSTTHLQVLEAGLKILKPDYRTIEELKAEREFAIDEQALATRQEEARKDAERCYQEQMDRYRRYSNGDEQQFETLKRAYNMLDLSAYIERFVDNAVNPGRYTISAS